MKFRRPSILVFPFVESKRRGRKIPHQCPEPRSVFWSLPKNERAGGLLRPFARLRHFCPPLFLYSLPTIGKYDGSTTPDCRHCRRLIDRLRQFHVRVAKLPARWSGDRPTRPVVFG